MNDLAVPAGAISSMNALDRPKLGRYAFEVRDEEIVAARIVAVDLHWAIALPAFERLLERIRRVHPAAFVVVGGITAGHYGAQLVQRHPIDAVIVGDSETSFRALVEAVLEGRPPTAIPNLVLPGPVFTPRLRMTPAEFDATDCLSTDWFPAFENARTWDSRAFSHAPTLPVVRGCPMRCPTCYGSFASTFGRGVLHRSPSGLVAQIRRGAEMGLRQISLFLGRIPASVLREHSLALARAGPFPFELVRLFLCTPPACEDLDALERAFGGLVNLSAVAPAEHVPPPDSRSLAAQMTGWRRAAERIERSGRIDLELWHSEVTTAAAMDEAISPTLRRTRKSLASPWALLRPTDGLPLPGLDELSATMEPLWTFDAARLLTPPLAASMAPFGDLDDLKADPTEWSAGEGPLRGYWEEAIAQWKKVRLALLPSLRFSIVPARTVLRLQNAAETIRLAGRAGIVFPQHLGGVFAPASAPLVTRVDEARVHLGGEVEAPAEANALLVVPHPPGPETFGHEWVAAIAPWGLLALVIPPGRGTVALTVSLFLKRAALVAVRDGATIASGRADMHFFSKVVPGPNHLAAVRDDGQPGPATDGNRSSGAGCR